MNLYLISQSENNDYDTYDSAVVAAMDETQAKRISPVRYYEWSEQLGEWEFVKANGSREVSKRGDWASHPDKVDVELIGTASEGTPPGLIMASFNAG